MAVDVETLVVRLEGRVTDFERSMQKAQRSAQTASAKIGGTFAAMNKRLVSTFRTVGTAAGIVGLAALPRVIGDIVKSAGDLVDTADKIGITTAQLQELKFAAGQTGVEFSELTNGLSFFSRSIGEASRGQGELFDILKANGVAVRDQAGNVRPLMELLFAYADLVKNAASQEERATLVTKAFGRSSDELINTLVGGRAELRRYGEQAKATGQILDEDLLRRAEELGDRWDVVMGQLTTSWQSFVLSIVTGAATARNAIDSFLQQEAEKDNLFGAWLRGLQSLGRPGGIPALPGGLGANPAAAPDPMATARARATEDLRRRLFDLQHLVGKPTILPGKTSTAVTANAELEAAIARNIDRMDEFRDVASDALSTFISDLREGKSAAEALGNVLDRIADKLINVGIEQLVAALLGASGGAGGGLIGALFGGFRQAGGPVSAGRGYVVGEHGKELFVPNVSGRIVANRHGGVVRHAIELFLSPEADARILRVGAPQARDVSITITRANNKQNARRSELQG